MGYPFDCHLIVGWPYADAWLAVSGFVRGAQGAVPRRRGVHGLSGLAALAGRAGVPGVWTHGHHGGPGPDLALWGLP